MSVAATAALVQGAYALEVWPDGPGRSVADELTQLGDLLVVQLAHLVVSMLVRCLVHVAEVAGRLAREDQGAQLRGAST